jgi:hypothetical protein
LECISNLETTTEDFAILSTIGALAPASIAAMSRFTEVLAPPASQYKAKMFNQVRSWATGLGEMAIGALRAGHICCVAYWSAWSRTHEGNIFYLAPEAAISVGLLLGGARQLFVVHRAYKLHSINESSY